MRYRGTQVSEGYGWALKGHRGDQARTIVVPKWHTQKAGYSGETLGQWKDSDTVRHVTQQQPATGRARGQVEKGARDMEQD